MPYHALPDPPTETAANTGRYNTVRRLMRHAYLRTPEISKTLPPKDVKGSKAPNLGNYHFGDRQLTVASLFSGAGGLDLGFQNAGFKTVWANENDPKVWATYNHNFPHTPLDRRSITEVPVSAIPDIDGIIGGPPCQGWSIAGTGRGISDYRGVLFYDYIRVLKAKQPLFFLAENVQGILHAKHADSFNAIISELGEAGYLVNYKLLNAHDYDVPQDRHRVIIVGFHKKKVGFGFQFPEAGKRLTLFDAIADLQFPVVPALGGYKTNGSKLEVPNHEYLTGSYSTMYLSRNRVRSWNEPSFTIQAGGRHAPIHPQAPKMKEVSCNVQKFVPGKEHLYRRLSVRECARIQTFPDDFIFRYENILDGYRMVGNAVPVNFSFHLAKKIRQSLAYTATH